MRWIAEIGSNHNGSLERALALVEAAARAGFTDVKTQSFRVREMFAPEALEARPELRLREKLEVPWSWHPQLRQRVHALGMRYGITVCHRDDVDELSRCADWLKVGSYSLLDVFLLKALSQAGKPLVVSTGMATEKEVNDALYHLIVPFAHLPVRPLQLTLLHCVSTYPAPYYEANLRSIPYLRERFAEEVGWSDHTLAPFVLNRAESVHGASMIELHWDLEDGLGAEAGHSWTPKTFKVTEPPVVDKEGYYACDGKAGVKAPSVSESAERDWRADPSDGMRPLLALRTCLKPSSAASAK